MERNIMDMYQAKQVNNGLVSPDVISEEVFKSTIIVNILTRGENIEYVEILRPLCIQCISTGTLFFIRNLSTQMALKVN